MSRILLGNRVELLHSGAEYFPALLAAIEGAQHEVLLESYLFAADDTGNRVAAALRAAAMRGVTVRVMVDGFGARSFVFDMLPDLAADGVEVLIFRREIKALSFRRQRLRRLHRKLVVVDGALAFVGGINVIDDMDTPRLPPPRFDFAVRLQGPVVAAVHEAMVQLWRTMCWASFRRRPRSLHWVEPARGRMGSVAASFLIRDNILHRNDIENAYLEMLERARDQVLIANAYFLPGRRFRHALVDAARRGVKITLLLQGKAEYWLLYHATRALYPHLMAENIRIVEYRRGFLHAKVAVADEHWATVGSSNIDPFSLLLAREANVIVYDAGFAAQLRASLHEAMTLNAEELDAAAWRSPLLPHRLLSWFALGMVRLLIGLAGYARRH